jgi:hypothetical protein
MDPNHDREKLADDLLKLAYDQAERVLLNSRKGQIVPAFVIVGQDGTRKIIATPWKDDREKRLTLLIIKQALSEINGIAYSLVVEAWMLELDPNEYADAQKSGKDLTPSKSERRIEIVDAFACVKIDAGLRKISKIWEIIRDNTGRVTELKQRHNTSNAAEGQGTGGALASLLDD